MKVKKIVESQVLKIRLLWAQVWPANLTVLLGALEALLANRPFSAVTMDTLVTTPSHMGDKNLDQTEYVCPKKGEENVSFNVNREPFCNPDIISNFIYSTKLSLALLFNILH